MRARALAVAMAMAAALGPLAASAWGGAWGAPMGIGVTQQGGVAALAMDASGTAAATWWDTLGQTMVAVRDPGGAFGAPQDLDPSFEVGSLPRVALDGAGRALVVWHHGGFVRAAERAPRGAFAMLPPIGPGVGTSADVAFLGDGTAIVAYAGTDGAAHVAQRAPGGAFVVSALPASPGASVDGVRVAAAGGYAVVTWIETTQSGSVATSRALASVMTPGGGGFGAPTRLMTTTSDASLSAVQAGIQRVTPALAASGAADVILSWAVAGPMSDASPVQCTADTVATRTAGGGGVWTPNGADAGASCLPGVTRQAVVAENGAGHAMLLLGQGFGAPPGIVLVSKLRLADAPVYYPGPPVFSDTTSTPAGPWAALASLSGGRYLAAFLRGPNVVATVGDPVKGFGPATTVASDPTTSWLLGVASNGTEAVVAWLYSAHGTGTIRAALYDDRATARVALSGLTMSRRRFGRLTTIHWQLGVPATVTFRVARLRGARATAVGSFTRSAKAGTGSLRFHGVVHGHRLRPGRYRLTVVASAPGMAPSAPASVTFTVVR